MKESKMKVMILIEESDISSENELPTVTNIGSSRKKIPKRSPTPPPNKLDLPIKSPTQGLFAKISPRGFKNFKKNLKKKGKKPRQHVNI